MKRLKLQNGESPPRAPRPRYLVLYARPAGVVTEATSEWIMAASQLPPTSICASADNRPSSRDIFGTSTDSCGTPDVFAMAPTRRQRNRFSGFALQSVKKSGENTP